METTYTKKELEEAFDSGRILGSTEAVNDERSVFNKIDSEYTSFDEWHSQKYGEKAEKIIINENSLTPICMGCPSDWDAKTDKGDEVYIRLRHGHFYIQVNSQTIESGNPSGYDGVMSTSEMIKYVNENLNKVRIQEL